MGYMSIMQKDQWVSEWEEVRCIKFHCIWSLKTVWWGTLININLFIYLFLGEGVQAEAEAPPLRAAEQHRRDQSRKHGLPEGKDRVHSW